MKHIRGKVASPSFAFKIQCVLILQQGKTLELHESVLLSYNAGADPDFRKVMYLLNLAVCIWELDKVLWGCR